MLACAVQWDRSGCRELLTLNHTERCQHGDLQVSGGLGATISARSDDHVCISRTHYGYSESYCRHVARPQGYREDRVGSTGWRDIRGALNVTASHHGALVHIREGGHEKQSCLR
jgi:hypothetical protein